MDKRITKMDHNFFHFQGRSAPPPPPPFRSISMSRYASIWRVFFSTQKKLQVGNIAWPKYTTAKAPFDAHLTVSKIYHHFDTEFLGEFWRGIFGGNLRGIFGGILRGIFSGLSSRNFFGGVIEDTSTETCQPPVPLIFGPLILINFHFLYIYSNHGIEWCGSFTPSGYLIFWSPDFFTFSCLVSKNIYLNQGIQWCGSFAPSGYLIFWSPDFDDLFVFGV